MAASLSSAALVVPGVQPDLLALLRSELSGEEQRIFVGSFAAYLQYGETDEFVISLDDAYEWAGFTTKGNGKALLVKKLQEGSSP